MKVLVCGSREWRDADTIRERLSKLPRGTEIIHGAARGADRLAGTVAASLGMQVTEFPADWDRYGRSAGFRRNVLMLDQSPDLVIAFWLNGSTGTKHTVDQADLRGIPVEVFDDR